MPARRSIGVGHCTAPAVGEFQRRTWSGGVAKRRAGEEVEGGVGGIVAGLSINHVTPASSIGLAGINISIGRT